MVSGDVKRLKLSGSALNFDYAHFLPQISRCAVLHGHSARVRVEIEGLTDSDGIIVDFGELKNSVKEVLNLLDHKLIVRDRYVKEISNGKVLIEFTGKGGDYSFLVPLESAVIVDFESTVENISGFIARQLLSKLGSNVISVRVLMSEGFGKFAESLAER